MCYIQLKFTVEKYQLNFPFVCKWQYTYIFILIFPKKKEK